VKYFLLSFFFVSLFSACNDEEEQPDILTGLIAYMPLNGAAYDSVSATTGTIHEATPAPDRNGAAGQAMQFAGNDSSYIDFGDLEGASFPENIFTISCWIRAADTTSTLSVLSKRTDTGPFEYSMDNHFNIRSLNLDNWVPNGAGTVYGIDPLDASVPVKPGIWQHIAFVADGELLRAYADGVLQGATDIRQAGMSFGNTTAPFVIGRGGAFGVNHYFNGAIDEVRLYNRVLDAEAVRALAK